MPEITARLKPRVDPGSRVIRWYGVHCGHCGQELGSADRPAILCEHCYGAIVGHSGVCKNCQHSFDLDSTLADPLFEKPWTLGIVQGWRFEHGIWEPTRYHLQKRADVRRKVDTMGGPRSDSRRADDQERLQRGQFGRTRDLSRDHDIAAEKENEAKERYLNEPGRNLPTRVRCPKCSRINRVEPIDEDCQRESLYV